MSFPIALVMGALLIGGCASEAIASGHYVSAAVILIGGTGFLLALGFRS